MSPACKYFMDYWEDLFSGVSSAMHLMKSFNPRVIISELLDEINTNKQNNKVNEEFFKRTLSGYLKADPVLQKSLKLNIQMILKEMDLTKHRPRYLPSLCQATLKKFQNLEYFQDCVDELVGLTNKSILENADKETIKIIVNNLIVEFREIGYVDDEIRKIPEILFSTVNYYHEQDLLVWDYPHGIVCADCKNTEQKNAWKEKIKEFESTLTEIDRLNALLKTAKKPKEAVTYIFRVNGMGGSEEIKVDDVIFYPPTMKKYLKQESFLGDDAELTHFRNYDDKSINAMVTVNAISEKSGELIARSKVDKSFNLLRRVMRKDKKLWLSKTHLAIGENEKILSASSHAFEQKEDDKYEQFLVDASTKLNLEKNIRNIELAKSIAEKNGWGRRFNESCYWLKRAEESNSNVDMFLAYWISIETLCTKSEGDSNNWFSTNEGQKESDIYLIREVIGKLRAIGKCYGHGWNIHHHLRSAVNSPLTFLNILQLPTLPVDLIERAQLNSNVGEIVRLKNFIDALNEIIEVLPDDYLLKDQLIELALFYKESKVAQKTLRENFQSTKDELGFIYRMRNKIAHDGSSEHPLLPSLCKIVAQYAVFFFNQVCVRASDEKQEEKDLRSILISAVQNYDEIEMRLENETAREVFLKD